MKVFIYKALIVVFLSFLLFEFTLGQKIKEIDSKIENLNSKGEREKIANKIRKEIERAGKRKRRTQENAGRSDAGKPGSERSQRKKLVSPSLKKQAVEYVVE